MEAIIVAIITGGFGIAGIILNRRLRISNSADHAEVRKTISDHSVQIGILTERVEGVREDLSEIRDDLRHVRDALTVPRDSSPLIVHEDLYEGRNGSGTRPSTIQPDLPDWLGIALGGGISHEPVADRTAIEADGS